MDDFKHIFDSNDPDSVLIGRGASIVQIPADHWKSHVATATERISDRLTFLTREHHLVRRFVVREIALQDRPVIETRISSQLKLPRARVRQILDELESRLFFLVRNARGAVSWAYPFTADETPHRVLRQSRRPARAA